MDRHLTWITSLYSAMLDDEREDLTEPDNLAARWATSFHELAQELRRNTTARKHSAQITATRLIIDMQDDVARSALGAGLTQQQFEDWLLHRSQEDLARLPYLGTMYAATHTRLRNADDVWNSHDLTDMIYLACASAYTDIVVCEKRPPTTSPAPGVAAPAAHHSCPRSPHSSNSYMDHSAPRDLTAVGAGYEQVIASLGRWPGAHRDTSLRQFIFCDGAGGVWSGSGPTCPGRTWTTCGLPWTPRRTRCATPATPRCRPPTSTPRRGRSG